MAKKLNATRLTFIDWLANPLHEGNQQDFAVKFAVHETTLSDWKKDPKLWAAVWDRWHSVYLPSILPEVNKVAVKKALAGDNQALDRIYKLANKLTDKVEVSGKLSLDDLMIEHQESKHGSGKV